MMKAASSWKASRTQWKRCVHSGQWERASTRSTVQSRCSTWVHGSMRTSGESGTRVWQESQRPGPGGWAAGAVGAVEAAETAEEEEEEEELGAVPWAGPMS